MTTAAHRVRPLPAPEPGVRVLLDLSALAREAQQRRRAAQAV